MKNANNKKHNDLFSFQEKEVALAFDTQKKVEKGLPCEKLPLFAELAGKVMFNYI